MSGPETSQIETLRGQIAAAIARALYGGRAALTEDERGRVEDETAAVIARTRAVPDLSEPAPPGDGALPALLAAYRRLEDLGADERDATLAAQGEVFAREDDA